MQIAAEFVSFRRSARPVAQVGLAGLESRFVENWAGLAAVFGMEEAAGKVHAVVYLAQTPLSAGEIAAQLGMREQDVMEQVEALTDLGVVEGCNYDDGHLRFAAESDPWAWFMRAIKARGRQELMPILGSVRQIQELAKEARRSGNLSAADKGRLEHMLKFSQFVDQLASLMETFMSLGAGPLMATMKMASRFLPRG